MFAYSWIDAHIKLSFTFDRAQQLQSWLLWCPGSRLQNVSLPMLPPTHQSHLEGSSRCKNWLLVFAENLLFFSPSVGIRVSSEECLSLHMPRRSPYGACKHLVSLRNQKWCFNALEALETKQRNKKEWGMIHNGNPHWVVPQGICSSGPFQVLQWGSIHFICRLSAYQFHDPPTIKSWPTGWHMVALRSSLTHSFGNQLF